MENKAPIFFTHEWPSTVTLASTYHVACRSISRTKHTFLIHWHQVLVRFGACLVIHYRHDGLLKNICWFSSADSSSPTYMNDSTLKIRHGGEICREWIFCVKVSEPIALGNCLINKNKTLAFLCKRYCLLCPRNRYLYEHFEQYIRRLKSRRNKWGSVRCVWNRSQIVRPIYGLVSFA